MKKIFLKTIFVFGLLFVLSNVVFAYTPANTLLQRHRNRDPVGHAILFAIGSALFVGIISVFDRNKKKRRIRNILYDTNQFKEKIFRKYSNRILLPNEQEDDDKISAEDLDLLIDSYIEVIKKGNKVTFEEYIQFIKKE